MKDEFKNLKMCSGSAACSEASTGVGLGPGTFARPPPPSSRWIDAFFQGEYNSKGHRKWRYSWIEKMVPQQAQRWIDWNQTRKEQGTWPRKIMVSMWFKHETSLTVMIDLLKVMWEEFDKAPGSKSVLRGGSWHRSKPCFFKGGGGRGWVKSESLPWKNFKSLSLWEGNLLSNTHARAKVTRMKVGLSLKL